MLETLTVTQPVPAPPTDPVDTDALLEPLLADAIATLGGHAPLLTEMAAYHLGRDDASMTSPTDGTGSRGKRLRPAVALLSCAAAGGEPATAAPLAAAIELLHNFTLVHDDIQDKSLTRRHRPTVWKKWDEGQAINAGDALFAAAHLALYRLTDRGVRAEPALRLIEAFDRTTIEIVQGQTLDLGFEGRGDVTPADYVGMIGLKTAAIVRYAAWAGALLAGVDEATADRFGAFGRALGLGFQVRDDLLGIWGAPAETGKAAADDIRRRKQSLPILLLREQAEAATRTELDALYGTPVIDEAGVARVLALLDAADVRPRIEQRVQAFHDEARVALLAAARFGPNPARDRLLAVTDSLATRAG